VWLNGSMVVTGADRFSVDIFWTPVENVEASFEPLTAGQK
jgi:hypothetical protein